MPEAIYNEYGDTIEFSTGFGSEPGVLVSCVFINQDLTVYKQLKTNGKITKVVITGIIRLFLDNPDIKSYLVENKIKFNTLLSYIPRESELDPELPKLTELLKEISKLAKNSKIEVDLTKLVNHMNEEPN